MDQGKPVAVDYDERADVMYVTLGQPRASYSIEPEEGILLRADIYTGELNGITIVHFRRRLRESGERLASHILLVPADLIPAVIREWRLQQAAA